MALRHELDQFDDHTFYLIQEVSEGERTKEHIDISLAHVFKTIYGAFMAYPNLGVNISNKKKKYAIYYVHPNSRDILIPYHFENEEAWFTGEVVLCRNFTFHHLCTGYLEYERSVFTYEDNTDFAYLTFTAFPDTEAEMEAIPDYEELGIKKQLDFDLNHLVKGHFSHFWFIKNVGIKEND